MISSYVTLKKGVYMDLSSMSNLNREKYGIFGKLEWLNQNMDEKLSLIEEWNISTLNFRN